MSTTPTYVKINFEKKTTKKVRIVCISDTHEKMGELMETTEIPNGDIFIHCGDFSNGGGEDVIKEFNEQLGKLPHKHKLVICGNHDSYHHQTKEEIQKQLTNCTYIQNESVIIENIKFYGSPTMTVGRIMAFRAKGNALKIWNQIPLDTDILVTHVPPFGILDQNEGCKVLKEVVEKIKPKVHCFGHVHGRNGYVTIDETTFINSASEWKPLVAPYYFDFEI
eukprot:gene3134-5450_t